MLLFTLATRIRFATRFGKLKKEGVKVKDAALFEYGAKLKAYLRKIPLNPNAALEKYDAALRIAAAPANPFDKAAAAREALEDKLEPAEFSDPRGTFKTAKKIYEEREND